MSRTGITYDDVVEAATNINSDGEVPTIEKIRSYLGGTGSNSTISKYLQEWRKLMSTGKSQSDKSPTPAVVQAAVESVWQQMREQADAEMAKIKEETRQQVAEAEQLATIATEERSKFEAHYQELQEVHYAVSAEKELLTLNLKGMNEKYALLEERFKALTDRHAEMQAMTAVQLNMAAKAHEVEINRLEEKLELQKASHEQQVNELKERGEQERHTHMLALDSVKIEQQKKEKHFNDLQLQLQNATAKIAKLEAELIAANNMQQATLNQLSEQEAKWQLMNDKIIISDEFASKLYNMPDLENIVNLMSKQLNQVIEGKFLTLMNTLNTLWKQKEAENA